MTDTIIAADPGAGKTGPYPVPDPRATFILALGRALHGAGEPSDVLEDLLERIARQVGVQAQFFITPTSIFAAFGPEDRQRTHLIRTEPASSDLGTLARLDRIVVRVLQGELDPVAGIKEIAASEERPIQRNRSVQVLGFSLASAGAARLLGGGLREVIVAAVVGMTIGLLSMMAARNQTLQRLFEVVASFTTSLLVGLIAHLAVGLDPLITGLGSLVVLLPGMTLTSAISELTTRHLVSGAARLMSALMTFLSMAFGVALAYQLALLTSGPPPVAVVTPLPAWTQWIAIGVAALSFGLLLRAERRDFGWILLACLLGFTSSRLAAGILGPELGMFVGALTVGLGSSLVARFADQPAAITNVPGILILVPGTIGLRGVTALLQHQVVSGLESVFRGLLIAMSLAIGLLVANLLLPPPRR